MVIRCGRARKDRLAARPALLARLLPVWDESGGEQEPLKGRRRSDAHCWHIEDGPVEHRLLRVVHVDLRDAEFR